MSEVELDGASQSYKCYALQEAAAKEWPQRRQATFKPVEIPSEVTSLLLTLHWCRCGDARQAPTFSFNIEHQCLSSMCRTQTRRQQPLATSDSCGCRSSKPQTLKKKKKRQTSGLRCVAQFLHPSPTPCHAQLPHILAML